MATLSLAPAGRELQPAETIGPSERKHVREGSATQATTTGVLRGQPGTSVVLEHNLRLVARGRKGDLDLSGSRVVAVEQFEVEAGSDVPDADLCDDPLSAIGE